MNLNVEELTSIVTNREFAVHLGSMVTRAEAGGASTVTLYRFGGVRREQSDLVVGGFVLKPNLDWEKFKVAPDLVVRSRALGSVRLLGDVLVPEYADLVRLNKLNDANPDAVVGLVARQPEHGFGLTLIRGGTDYAPQQPVDANDSLIGAAAGRVTRLMRDTGVRQATMLYGPYSEPPPAASFLPSQDVPPPRPLMPNRVSVEPHIQAQLGMLYT